MDYTPLHAHLGRTPEPLTAQLIDEAVSASVAEARDLDWKRSLPPKPGETDFPKDIAAMANSGGGMIVYGVEESNKVATGRFDVGDVDEKQERTLRAVSASKISPPVLNLQIHRLGTVAPRALAVIVPASGDGPHLIFDNQRFAAPYRVDADTFWMSESQLAVAYRARFEGQREADAELGRLYAAAVRRARPTERVWLAAAARRRSQPVLPARLTEDEARNASATALAVSERLRTQGMSALRRVDRGAVRSGLRSKVLKPLFSGPDEYREAWVSLHDDGSVTVAQALGGAAHGDGNFDPLSEVLSWRVEAAIADLMALLHGSALRHGWGECDVQVGLEFAGTDPILIASEDRGFTIRDWSTPISRYEPLRATVMIRGDLDSLLAETRELATDAISQGGLTFLKALLDKVAP